MPEPSKVAELARLWLREHWHQVKGASVPGDHRRDPDTGETLDDASSPWLNRWGNNRDYLAEHQTVYPFSHLEDLGDEERQAWRRVHSGSATLSELDIRQRMERAFGELTEEQQQLLRLRYFEALTLDEMAADLKPHRTKQAIAGRLKTAVADLNVAIVTTWNLPVLGRPEEGRPPRNYDAEKAAADMTIESYFKRRGAI